MANRFLPTALLGLALAFNFADAQAVVRVGPPPPRKEVIVVRPGPAYIWQPGYYRWNKSYIWVPGRWVRPPQAYYHSWIPGHWRQTPRGWVWVEGHWAK